MGDTLSSWADVISNYNDNNDNDNLDDDDDDDDDEYDDDVNINDDVPSQLQSLLLNK